MSKQKRDPQISDMPEQAKVPETPETRVAQELQKETDKVETFKKDVKFLWIYASVFCAVLLLLIGASYIIQGKIHAEVDSYKNQAESANQNTTQTQSRLRGIQEENEKLKKNVSELQSKNNLLEAESSVSSELIEKAEQALLEQQKLTRVLSLLLQGKITAAKEAFASVNETALPSDTETAEIYTYCKERLK